MKGKKPLDRTSWAISTKESRKSGKSSHKKKVKSNKKSSKDK